MGILKKNQEIMCNICTRNNAQKCMLQAVRQHDFRGIRDAAADDVQSYGTRPFEGAVISEDLNGNDITLGDLLQKCPDTNLTEAIAYIRNNPDQHTRLRQ